MILLTRFSEKFKHKSVGIIHISINKQLEQLHRLISFTSFINTDLYLVILGKDIQSLLSMELFS